MPPRRLQVRRAQRRRAEHAGADILIQEGQLNTRNAGEANGWANFGALGAEGKAVEDLDDVDRQAGIEHGRKVVPEAL